MSRKALDVLRESGVDFEIVEYLKNPPTAAELNRIVKGLNKEPTDILRTKDKRFKELNLSKKERRSQDEWIDLMVQNPSIIERPIVINGNRVALGRPPESVKDILD